MTKLRRLIESATQINEALEKGKTYTLKKDLMISDDIGVFEPKEISAIKKNKWVKPNGFIVLPKGTEVVFLREDFQGYSYKTKQDGVIFELDSSDPKEYLLS